MPSRFSDRFDESTYADDPLTHVFATGRIDEAIEIPERIFDRLAHLGRAYELHLLPLLGGHEPVGLNATQVGALIDELELLCSVTQDPIVERWAQELRAFVRQVADSGGSVTIEGN
jgi:hypothetical protein